MNAGNTAGQASSGTPQAKRDRALAGQSRLSRTLLFQIRFDAGDERCLSFTDFARRGARLEVFNQRSPQLLRSLSFFASKLEAKGDLPIRTQNVLANAEIEDLYELSRWSAKELMALRHMREQDVDAIRGQLAKRNWRLRGER